MVEELNLYLQKDYARVEGKTVEIFIQFAEEVVENDRAHRRSLLVAHGLRQMHCVRVGCRGWQRVLGVLYR